MGRSHREPFGTHRRWGLEASGAGSAGFGPAAREPQNKRDLPGSLRKYSTGFREFRFRKAIPMSQRALKLTQSASRY